MSEETERDRLVRIEAVVGTILKRLDEFASSFVTKDEFRPVRNVVYGLVGIICLTVVGAMVAVVLKR